MALMVYMPLFGVACFLVYKKRFCFLTEKKKFFMVLLFTMPS